MALGGVLVAIAGVVAAFATVFVQHLDQQDLMRIQVSIEMVKLYDSPDLRRARTNFSRALLKGTGVVRDERVLDFFETLALYFEQDRIDADSVYVNFSYPIARYWAASKDAVYAMRAAEADDELYRGFEELNEKIGAYSNEPAGQRSLTAERTRRFLQDEAALPR